MRPNKKTANILQIGIHRQDEQWQFLWFDEQKQPHFLTKNDNPPLKLSDLTPQFAKSICTWIACLPNQHVWAKTIILTQKLNEQECQQQCNLIIENELPTDFDDIWYDYQYKELTQGAKLAIYVVRKQTAQNYVHRFFPIKINTLDCLSNSLLRAFHYFHPQKEKMETLYLYQDRNGCIAIQEIGQQTIVLQKNDKNITALYQEFCQRFNCQPQQVWCYCEKNEQQNITHKWNIINTELPFIALGNALWGRNELYQITELKE